MTEPDPSPPPAFPDQVTVPLTKAVNLTQLTDELDAALGRQVQIAQLGPDNGAPAAEDNPAELAIAPSDVDTAVVEQVIADHNPDQTYATPAVERDFTAAMQKVVDNDGATLNGDDMQAALRGLLLREAARRAP